MKLVSLLLAMSVFSLVARADDSFLRNELQGGAFAGVTGENFGSTTGVPESSDTYVRLSADYGYFFDSHLEGLASFDTTITTGDSSSSTLLPMVGLAYNFGDSQSNAIYLAAKVGENFYTSASSHKYNAFEWLASVGKRVQFSTTQISWKPEIYVFSRASATATDNSSWTRASYLGYGFIPFQFSILF